MADESSSPSTGTAESTPAIEKTAERAFWRGLWDMKKLTLWLAGPSALLVFLNQLLPIWTIFRAGPNSVPKVVIEHRAGFDLPEDPKLVPLVLEDTRFDANSPQTLELIARNRSQHPIFVQEATVEVLRTWELEPATRSRGMLARSAEYNVLLPASESPVAVQLSQEIAPNSLDRFALKLGLASRAGSQAGVFSIRVNLSCEGKTVPAGEFLCLLMVDGASGFPEAKFNRAAVDEIKKTAGKRNAALEAFLAPAGK